MDAMLAPVLFDFGTSRRRRDLRYFASSHFTAASVVSAGLPSYRVTLPLAPAALYAAETSFGASPPSPASQSLSGAERERKPGTSPYFAPPGRNRGSW